MRTTYNFGNVSFIHEVANLKHRLHDDDNSGLWAPATRVLTYEKFKRQFAVQLLTLDLPIAFEIKSHDGERIEIVT